MLRLNFLATVFALLTIVFHTGLADAQIKPVASKSDAKSIPLIPRELFFDNPEVSGSQLSPDGKKIAFLKANKGIMNIWVKKIEEPFSQARPVTASKDPMSGYFWTYDGRYILFVEAKGGNENYNIYAVDPFGKADPKTGVPHSRNLTPNSKVRAEIMNVSKKDPNVLWVGLNDRDEKWHDLYRLEISSGKLTLLEKNTDRLSGWLFDWDENVRLAIRNPEDGSTEVLRRNPDGKYSKIYDCGVLETCNPSSFTKDNSKVYMETNKGTADLTKLVLLDPQTMAVKDVEQDPLNKVDFGNLFISDKSHELILTEYADEKIRRYFRDKTFEEDFDFLQSQFPGMEITYRNSDLDETKFLIGVYSDNKVPEVYLYERAGKRITYQYNLRPKLAKYEQYFGSMDPITYKSSDGLEIPAYLSLPKGVEPKNLPLIVFPHGGPWSRDYWGFNTYAQWLTNRGYAVLSMNFRGSTGYGKKFLNAGNKQWGMLMQDDITWGVKHLVSKGIADPKRVGIMGGSYGGYATLAGLAFTPDVYAAGVDIVGPSNLITLLNSIPPYWEAGRKQFLERMGDPSTPEGKALLEKQSPLNSAAKIKAPLMIIQGANDPRVKKAESDQIAIALRDLGRDVIYLCAADEGHGYRKPVNNLAAMGKAEVFLGKALHARYQPTMQPDAAAKLKQITVNVASLTLPKKLEAVALKTLPTPTADLSPGNCTYSLLIEMQGQKIPMTLIRTVKEENGQWVVTDKVSSPMGDQSDEAIYTKQALLPLSRKSVGGGQTVSFTYAPDKVISAMGGKNVTTNVSGAYLPDGAGHDLVLARLPLKEGYEAAFYVATQDGKVNLSKLSVKGKETIGGAECYKCELVNTEDPTDKTTYYVGVSDRTAHRIISGLTGVPGAKVTMDLRQ